MGLDIGTSGVRAAELRPGRSGPVLERFGQVALPPGAVQDGEVVDPPAVAAALRGLWTQARFGTRSVVVGVANQKVVVRQVDLPWLPPAEMRASLAFQVQDSIPMAVEHALLDYHPLEERTDDAGARQLRVLLVAAARGMVDATLQAVTLAGLTPAVVDLTSFAVVRAHAHTDSGFRAQRTEALIDVGSSVTNIVVHQGGVPRFVRILLMGGADVTAAVAERLGVPTEQAEALKQSSSLTPVAGTDDATLTQRAMETAGAAFVEEVRGTLDYFLAQSGSGAIHRIVLSGGGSRLAGLAERLASATRLPVDPARPLELLALGRTGLTEEQLAYAEPVMCVPVGLGLGVAA